MGDEPAGGMETMTAIMDLVSGLIFYTITLLFVLISVVMIILAFDRLYLTVIALPNVALELLFECIGFTTVSAAVIELAKTMYEEEIRSRVRMNAPRKIRRFVSRFMTVIIISLSIEFLTMVFRYSHKTDEFAYLANAAAVAIGVAAIFVAWAIFNKYSVPVEKIEHDIPDKVNGDK